MAMSSSAVDNDADFCDITEFGEWPMKKETSDIWEELDETVASFDTSQFIGKKGKCKERIDLKKLTFPRYASPDCGPVLSSFWDSHRQQQQQQKQKQKQPKQLQPSSSSSSSSSFDFLPDSIRTSCRSGGDGGRVVREAWTASRIVPRRQEHAYGQQVVEQRPCRLPSTCALAVQNVSQGRIGTIDLSAEEDFDDARGEKSDKGSHWKHVKNFMGVRGEQFVYLDGSVKIRERCCGGGGSGGRVFFTGSGDRKSSKCFSAGGGSSCKYLRPDFIRAPRTLANQYAERAKLGFAYWYQDSLSPNLCFGHKRTMGERR